MSGNEEQLEIDLSVDDAAKDDHPEIQIVDDKPATRAEKSVDEGIEELKQKLDLERQARFEAEKRANQATEQAYRASLEVEDTNLHLVNNAIDTIKRDSSILKNQYKEAMSVGDYDRVAEIQEVLSGNAVKLSQLESGKQAMESRPQQAQPQPHLWVDPIENIAAQVTPASADWLRRNKDHLGNKKTIDRMFRAHEDAIDDGIIADTRQYFEFIEGRLGLRKAVEVQEESALSGASAPTQRRVAPPSAPVTRSGTASGTRTNIVRLSGEEREMASMMGMTEKEYAQNKLALQKSGKLPN